MSQQKLKLTIELVGFSNDNGKAFVEVLTSENKAISQRIVSIKNKRASVEIEIPSKGKYAVKSFHDENNNQKLDKNLVGFPTEKWGVSNGVRPSFRAPNLDEMLFEINGTQKVTIKLD